MLRKLFVQPFQQFVAVTLCRTAHLKVFEHHILIFSECQRTHIITHPAAGDRIILVRRIAADDPPDLIEPELFLRCFRQIQMSVVDRIKCSAVNSDFSHRIICLFLIRECDYGLFCRTVQDNFLSDYTHDFRTGTLCQYFRQIFWIRKTVF